MPSVTGQSRLLNMKSENTAPSVNPEKKDGSIGTNFKFNHYCATKTFN